MTNAKHIDNEALLLKKFNERDGFAFGEIYDLLYNELYYFTSQLYRDTPFVTSDIIHDIFLVLWQKKQLEFVAIINIKAYMYVSIKNKYKNDIIHEKYVKKHTREVLSDKNSFVSDIVETETISIISQAIELLPTECAKVFKMHLDGWNVKEIATALEKTQSTVYNQRLEAISILKEKLSNRSFLTILINFF